MCVVCSLFGLGLLLLLIWAFWGESVFVYCFSYGLDLLVFLSVCCGVLFDCVLVGFVLFVCFLCLCYAFVFVLSVCSSSVFACGCIFACFCLCCCGVLFDCLFVLFCLCFSCVLVLLRSACYLF